MFKKTILSVLILFCVSAFAYSGNTKSNNESSLFGLKATEVKSEVSNYNACELYQLLRMGGFSGLIGYIEITRIYGTEIQVYAETGTDESSYKWDWTYIEVALTYNGNTQTASRSDGGWLIYTSIPNYNFPANSYISASATHSGILFGQTYTCYTSVAGILD